MINMEPSSSSPRAPASLNSFSDRRMRQQYVPEPQYVYDEWETFRKLPAPVQTNEAVDVLGMQLPPWKNPPNRERLMTDWPESPPQPTIFKVESSPPPQAIGRTSVGRYRYSAVRSEDGEFRVMELLPGSGLDPLAFKLRHLSIHDPQIDYDAMSYAWGEDLMEFTCDGQLMSIPKTLHGALLWLRDRTRSRFLFADAICLNQADESEKSLQVRLMGRIYQKARRVLVYLGDRDEKKAKVAFSLASQIRAQQSLPAPQAVAWGLLIQLFDRPWFKRLWCLQEVVLASRAEIVYGSLTAPWEDIGFAAAWICNVGYKVLSEWMTRVYPTHISVYPGIYMASVTHCLWSLARSGPEKRLSFFQLLSLTRPFIAKDDRDKVFGLLGIATEEADPGLGECFIEPDYSKTTQEIFTEVFRKFLDRQSNSLAFLGAVQLRNHALELPSWVPDWPSFCTRTLAPVDVLGHPKQSACSRLPPADAVLRDSALVVSGLLVDRVKTTIQLCSRRHLQKLVHGLSAAWVKNVEPCNNFKDTGIPLAEVFCWTITGGNNWVGRRVLASERRQHLTDYQMFLQVFPRLASNPPRIWPTSVLPNEWAVPLVAWPQIEGLDEAAEACDDAAKESGFRRFYEALCHACSNRTFFTTDKGYMGIGPRGLRPGGIVSVLSGAELPFILMDEPAHSHDGHPGSDKDVAEAAFSVVGECYVHGIMDGEVGGNDVLRLRLV